jgi:hypothetical protein
MSTSGPYSPPGSGSRWDSTISTRTSIGSIISAIASTERFTISACYIGAGVGVHWRGSHIADDVDNTARLYTGAVVGGDFFGGTTFALSKSRRFSLYAEARRVEAQNVERTLARLGVIVRFR